MIYLIWPNLLGYSSSLVFFIPVAVKLRLNRIKLCKLNSIFFSNELLKLGEDEQVLSTTNDLKRKFKQLVMLLITVLYGISITFSSFFHRQKTLFHQGTNSDGFILAVVMYYLKTGRPAWYMQIHQDLHIKQNANQTNSPVLPMAELVSWWQNML